MKELRYYIRTQIVLLQIETEDPYSDILEDIDSYDTSDYNPEHPLHNEKNKKVLGKMKDEMAGKIIAEYVGLRSKMYSIISPSSQILKKAKGVSKATVKRTYVMKCIVNLCSKEKHIDTG